MSNLDVSQLQPGDVVITEMGIWIVRLLIWIQALLTGNLKYAKSGHIIVVSHRDAEGRLWGIEGRPGGIGWVEMDKRAGHWGVSNVDQPKSADQRDKIVNVMKSLIGSRYDYAAYIILALDAVGISQKWTDYTGQDVPVQFVCSAVAGYVYEDVGLDNPGGMEITRFTVPAQWARFIDEKVWVSE
jgi:hypothetical protein